MFRMFRRYVTQMFVFLCLFLCFSCFQYVTVMANNVSSDSLGLLLSPYDTDSGVFIGSAVDEFKDEYYQHPDDGFSIGLSIRSKSSRMSLEDYIVNHVKAFDTYIDVSDYKISKDEECAPFYQIINQHPEIFYLEPSMNYMYDTDGYIVSYMVSYLYDKSEILHRQAEMESRIDDIVRNIDDDLIPIEKALLLHDYITLHCVYSDSDENDLYPDITHTAYGCIVDGVAVCDGYSDAFSYIMQSRFDIPCETIISESMLHAWNMIQLDGKWYHVDVTWDDPYFDTTGYADHKYFLLSDGCISDGSHNHKGWSSTYKADSSKYNNMFWSTVRSGIMRHHGEWFYSVYDSSSNRVRLMKRHTLMDRSSSVVYDTAVWGTSMLYYPGSYMYLSQDKERLYFNTNDAIYRLDPNEKAVIVHKPTKKSDEYVYAFAIQNNKLCYALQDSPNLKTNQVLHTFELEELKPSVRNMPSYQVPDSIKCKSGTVLSSVKLPDGFSWDKPDTKLVWEGSYSCSVSYTPDNQDYYIVASGIPVSVIVTCPGHKYTLVTENGVVQRVCSVCNDSYIDKYLVPGVVSGAKVKKLTSNSVTLQWNRQSGVKYKAELYDSNGKKLKSKSVSVNQVTFSGLRANVQYSIKIRAYYKTDKTVYSKKPAVVKVLIKK